MRALWMVVVGLLLCVSVPARAEDLAAAKAHFDQATAAFDLGDFKKAIAEYKLSYQASAKASTLYALGQSERLSTNFEDAIHSYERYLERSPTGKFADDARKFLAECKAALAKREQTRTSPPSGVPQSFGGSNETPVRRPQVTFTDMTPKPPDDERPRSKRALTIGLAAGAAVVVVAAVAIGLGVGLSGSGTPTANTALGTKMVSW